jgi:hypothetical protein
MSLSRLAAAFWTALVSAVFAGAAAVAVLALMGRPTADWGMRAACIGFGTVFARNLTRHRSEARAAG